MKAHLLLVACMVVVSFARGGGRDVLVAVGSLGCIQGELVEVGDTTLVIAVENYDETDEGLKSGSLRVVPLRNIQWVVVRGQDHVVTAAGLGFLGGGIIGGLVGGVLADKPPGGSWGIPNQAAGALEGAGIGAVIGLGIGYGIGSAVSPEEMRLESGDPAFKEKLRTAARYPLAKDSSGAIQR